MKYRLTQNLGTVDARFCNDKFGAGLNTDPTALAAGCVIELPTAAAEYLGKKYTALLEETRTVRGVAEAAKIKGVGDQS